MLRRFILCAVITFIACPASFANGQYVVNQFDIQVTKEPNSKVQLKLDSDAPDGLSLYVMIYRTYKSLDENTRKSFEEYLAYVETKVPVSELKKGVSYSLDHTQWKQAFANRQNERVQMGIKPLAKTISSKVVVSVGLINNDEFLGKGNNKLVGAAVKKEEWGDKTLESKRQVAISLSGAPKQAASLNPANLDIGQWYVTGRQDVPLMPHYDPPNKMAALVQVKKLPVGTPFKVRQRKAVNDEVWYSVDANFNTFNLSGWINSQAISAPGAIIVSSENR